MKTIIISGVCGFVGSYLAKCFREKYTASECRIVGFGNLSRPGYWVNLRPLKSIGIAYYHADVRNGFDVQSLPDADWVIEAAANASVLAGTEGGSRSLMDINLGGTINLLEFCRRSGAGIILLSTSRVYSLESVCRLPIQVVDDAFKLSANAVEDESVSALGLKINFSTKPPISPNRPIAVFRRQKAGFQIVRGQRP